MFCFYVTPKFGDFVAEHASRETDVLLTFYFLFPLPIVENVLAVTVNK